LHLEYIENLTLVTRAKRKTSAHLVSMDRPPFDRVKFVDMPAPVTKLQAIKAVPIIIWRTWRAIGPARIVHTGFGGWPICMGWMVVPMAKLRRKFVLANVESSFWRASPPGMRWRKRAYGHVGEYLTRYCLSMADVRLFTSKAYLGELLPPNSPRAYVTPATWLNHDVILGDEEAEAAWAAKTGPVRLLFSTRLIAEKGAHVMLGAIEAALAGGANVEVSIMGEGPLLEKCAAFAESASSKNRVKISATVPYGEPFLSLLRGFDASLVPSVSDEQPRICYDALSQAVPVVGSSTGGIREVVESGVTGRLVPPGDVGSLADALCWAGQNRPELRLMGLRGLASVNGLTHRAMHQNRHRILLEALGAS
jgi:glycosyltransferase involved in cell wall biosynthesis